MVAVLGSALLLQPRPAEPPAASAPPPPEPAPPPPPALPAPTPPLSRRDLIDAANLAAADYAAAASTSEDSKPLAERRFALRLPFGCDGPQVSGGASQAHFEFDPAKRTIKLVARPGDWTTLPMIQGADQAGSIEKVEGFWLPRPWSYAESCPPKRDTAVPAAPTPVASPSLGLARLYEKDGSRLLRRDGRAYELVRKIPEDDASSQTMTYQLVLEGRVAEFSTGQPIRCWSETAEHRPICLIAVEFDRVAFEDSAGKVLAEWRE